MKIVNVLGKRRWTEEEVHRCVLFSFFLVFCVGLCCLLRLLFRFRHEITAAFPRPPTVLADKQGEGEVRQARVEDFED